MVVFSPIFVADTKIIFRYDFVAPLELTIKTTKRHYWSRSGCFIVNCEHISHLFLAFLNARWVKDILRPKNNNYGRSHLRYSVFLTILQYSQEDNCVGVSFQ